jgi:hypothetical protein
LQEQWNASSGVADWFVFFEAVIEFVIWHFLLWNITDFGWAELRRMIGGWSLHALLHCWFCLLLLFRFHKGWQYNWIGNIKFELWITKDRKSQSYSRQR